MDELQNPHSQSGYDCSGNQLSNPFYRNLQSSSSQSSFFSQSMENILLIKKIIFIFKIPFLSQQVAKFLCLLPGEHQETVSSPTEPPRTMTSFLHLPVSWLGTVTMTSSFRQCFSLCSLVFSLLHYTQAFTYFSILCVWLLKRTYESNTQKTASGEEKGGLLFCVNRQ